MKQILLLLTLFINIFAFGQSSRSELANSKLFIKATYFDKKNDFIGLQTRTDLKDTIIEKVNYHKFQTSDFTDYSQIKGIKVFFESFEKDIYTLLDNNKKLVHKINYKTDKEQLGIIFGKQSQISLEYIDTRNSYAKDSLKVTEKTPRKYFQKNNSEIYLVIIPDLKTLAVSSNGQFYIKQLYGDNFNDISNGLKNNYSVSTRFDIQKGDEIQLFYRRKWYDDTTNLAEYEDKQFKNVKYLGDTISNNTKAMRFEVEGYNYLSGSYDSPEEFLVNISDSGYSIGYQNIPFRDFKTDLKIIENNNEKGLFLQGVTYETINGYTYPKIVQATSDPYRYYILPFFPMPYVEFGNIQGLITYRKIKGFEEGKKRERTYITNQNNIREINNKYKNEVEIVLYLIENAEVEIEIKDFETEKIVANNKSQAKIGINSFIIRSTKFEKDKEYSVQINYKSKENAGSFSNSVKIKY